jgi:hypothetical protein
MALEKPAESITCTSAALAAPAISMAAALVSVASMRAIDPGFMGLLPFGL